MSIRYPSAACERTVVLLTIIFVAAFIWQSVQIRRADAEAGRSVAQTEN